jgi:hypothetical protein
MFIRQFDERTKIAVLPFQILHALDIALDGGFLSAYSGSGLCVFPEIGMRRFLVEMFKIGMQSGEVKDAPVTRESVPRSP